METDRPGAAEERAALAWIRATDAILKGLNHAFSNDVSLLRLLAQVVRPGDVVDEVTQRTVVDAGRMDRLLVLYRLLPFAAGEPAEPTRVSDVVADAVSLLRLHLEFRDVECVVQGDAQAPPVLLHPSALTQAILLLLCAAAARLGPGVSEARVILRYDGDADWVRVAAETPGSAHDGEPADAPELAAVRWLIRDADGNAEVRRVPDGGTSVRMRVGTLQRLRRRTPSA